MDDALKLDKVICKAIVDGTLKGYLQYLEERKEKKRTMNVSGAYAWTKGNHIDDQVSRIGQDKGINFTIEKAGYTWEYLQFTVKENSEEYIIIVKNSKRVKKTLDELKHDTNKKDNYLVEYADINTPVFKNSPRIYEAQPEQIQLGLSSPDEIQAILESSTLPLNQNYSRFYIVTYEIDEMTKLMTSIQLTMPNHDTMDLILIEDLTDLIAESQYETTPEDVEPIRNEQISDQSIFSGDENAFGYSVPAEEEAEN